MSSGHVLTRDNLYELGSLEQLRAAVLCLRHTTQNFVRRAVLAATRMNQLIWFCCGGPYAAAISWSGAHSVGFGVNLSSSAFEGDSHSSLIFNLAFGRRIGTFFLYHYVLNRHHFQWKLSELSSSI